MFAHEEVLFAIKNVSTFDPDHLDYYNFLECIVRIAKAKPWTEEEEKECPDFGSKIEKISENIEKRYQDETMENFEQLREHFEAERHYQPRIVVDDEEGEGDYDDDEMQWNGE